MALKAFLSDAVSLDVPVILSDGRKVSLLPFHLFWTVNSVATTAYDSSVEPKNYHT